MSATKVKIVLELNSTDLQELLNAANFGSEGAIQLADMTGADFRDFKAELEGSAEMLKEELIETAEEACANDWLRDWHGEDEDDD